MRTISITITTTFLAEVDDPLVVGDKVNVDEISELVDWCATDSGKSMAVVVVPNDHIIIDVHSTEVEVDAELAEDDS